MQGTCNFVEIVLKYANEPLVFCCTALKSSHDIIILSLETVCKSNIFIIQV